MKCRPVYNAKKIWWECMVCRIRMTSVIEKRNCTGDTIENLFGGVFNK